MRLSCCVAFNCTGLHHAGSSASLITDGAVMSCGLALGETHCNQSRALAGASSLFPGSLCIMCKVTALLHLPPLDQTTQRHDEAIVRGTPQQHLTLEVSPDCWGSLGED